MVNNNKVSVVYKYNEYGICDALFIEKIHCRECGKSVIAVYNFCTTNIIIYEKDNFPSQKIEHEHKADVVTRTDLMHRTAIEIRYLRAPNQKDRRYLIKEGI